MCAQAISFARLRRLYYGAPDLKGGGVDHGAIVFNAKSCHHKPEIYGDIMAAPATKILKDFFKERR
jgi:tRNA(Arg) A34 adenosine deaminase TadA